MPEVAPIPLARLTTLRVGAAPARMIDARARDELIAALREVWADPDEPWFVLGGGSNLFAGDEPFPGTVIRILTSGFEIVPGAPDGFVRVRVDAGQNWDELVAWSVSQGLSGIEAMSGIPGTAGAAPIQNVGAYGQEIVQTLVDVDLIDEETGGVSTVPASELGLGTRTSALKHHYGSVAPRSAVVLSLTLDLADVGHEPRLVADERLRSALGVAPDQPVSVSWIRDTVLSIRGGKGMVLDEADHDTHSAGSFFNNPVVSEAVARALPADAPRWPLAPVEDGAVVIPLEQWDGSLPAPAPVERSVKLSAAWLIENSGLPKGYGLPRSRASLSTKHTLALTNRGGATAAEVAELARFVQSRVASEFGIVLMPEPVLVGVEL